jgi:hypothetical protein
MYSYLVVQYSKKKYTVYASVDIKVIMLTNMTKFPKDSSYMVSLLFKFFFSIAHTPFHTI